ncbi:hypothetical protein N8E89_00530 [Phyllobacterium sp. A18/5-2]|uniref:hypothetical protein n=1 Tax=Phyllobacterium sp. A18/5-2 TaxID=2978392 RepID=UPI0021C837BD|nr:hypothetical protein [Phyllobacterium sp. A18/5-2]UXN64411.1 hypothetical protein N8E89_00530 [Phyllobacterium sp. A18/5-2]
MILISEMVDKLTDDEVYERLHAALLAIGKAEGQTIRGDTSLKAARKALALLQMGLLKSMDDDSDRNVAVKDPNEI